MSRDPIIELQQLTKVYQVGDKPVHALRGVSLSVFSGEMIALVGASGSGKSTLMNILGCLDEPTSGHYRLLGEDVSRLTQDQRALLRNEEIGFVFQSYNLLARTSALENVALPMLYNGTPRSLRQARARDRLKLVGLTGREEHQPTQLSGGQQQRVAIAKALSNEPRVVLADEPTGNLDSKTGTEIIELFKELNRKGNTLVLVTHDLHLAAQLHRVVHLKDGLIEGEEARPRISQVPGLENDEALSRERGRKRGAGLFTNLRSAINALCVNKMRSALTMLGVIIGVAAVIAMLSASEGAKRNVDRLMEQLGSNRLVVRAGSFTGSGINWGSGSITTLTPADAEAFEREIPGVRAVAPIVSGSTQVVYKRRNWFTMFAGTTPEYVDIMNWGVETGSNFSEENISMASKVCLLGKTIVQELFDNEDPMGKIVRIKHVPFEVIGVLSERGASWGKDLDDVVLVPLSTAQKKLLGIRHVRRIEVSAVSQQATGPVQKSIEELLRQRHNITGRKLDDFRVKNEAALVRAANKTIDVLGYVLGTIALITLVVGGIGIMNIMLVSVTERTREIGIRLAVGARRRDIRAQFLTEAIVLSLFGGGVGVLLGVGASAIISLLGGLDTGYVGVLHAPISLRTIVIAFSFSAAVGIIFGFHPAARAAKLNPIDALRYE